MKGLAKLILQSARASTIANAVAAAIIGASVLSGCNVFPENDDSIQAQTAKENEKLKSVYTGLAGFYEGVLQSAEVGALDAQLIMYVEYEPQGFDPSGRPISRPVLRSQFRLSKVGEIDDHNLAVDYKEFSGDFVMTALATGGAAGGQGGSAGGQGAGAGGTAACPVGPRVPGLSISGRIVSGELTASVTGSNGVIGNFVAKKNPSKEAQQPLRDQGTRLQAAYSRLLGTYGGETTVENQAQGSTMILSIQNESVGVGITCPVLRASHRFKALVGKLDDTVMRGTYRETTGQLFFSVITDNQNVRVCSIGPKDPQLTFSGVITNVTDPNRTNREITGELNGSVGVFGAVNLGWESNNTKDVDDQYDRLRRAYRPAAGTYAGRFDGTEKFPVKITLDLIDTNVSGFVTCPALAGQYVRPDIGSDIGVIRLRADYYPADDRLVLTSVTADTPGGVAGNKSLSFTGVPSGDGWKGDMQWWVHSGSLVLDKCNSTKVDKNGNCK